MKNLNNIKLIFSSLLILSMVSCSEGFLDTKDPGNVTSDNFWNSTDDVEKAVNSLYPTFNRLMDGSSAAVNLRGDGIILGAPDFVQYKTFKNFTNEPENGESDYLWNVSYDLIFKTNTILEAIEENEFEDVDNLIAQTKFFRGMAYFRLAHCYGLAPIVLKATKNMDEINYPKADSEGKVWDQAISDLQAAIPDLEVNPSEIGRISKGAAQGFLGQLYLYRGDYLSQDSYYGEAVKEFKKIVDGGNYGLVDNWVDNFLATSENNKESLYEANKELHPGSYSSTQERVRSAAVPGIAQEIVFLPSEWLFNTMYEEKTINGDLDTRLLNTIYFKGGYKLFGFNYEDFSSVGSIDCTETAGGSFELDGASVSLTFEGFFRKYLNVNQNCDDVKEAVNNERILRYADVLLMYAEALVKSGAPLQDAALQVNKVRERAELDEITFNSTNEAMQEIEHQRIMELTMEGKRYFDLIRWGELKSELAAHGFANYAQNIDQEKHKYFPIPIDEVIYNELLDQNPLWD